MTKLFIGLLIGFILSSVPIKTQAVEFELKGDLAEAVNYPVSGVWWSDYLLGKEFTIQTSSPVIKNLLNQMGGKKVKIIIKVVGR